MNIRWCLYLIYYFSLCDAVLKFFPVTIGTIFRYLPEAFLYLLVLLLLEKRMRILSFPLFWPLCVCALSMTISGLINHSEMTGVVGDLRSFFRFSAFTYILWRTDITPGRIVQFIDGFLRLTLIELLIGGLELVGGRPVKIFFSPGLGWGSASGPVSGLISFDPGSFLAGTLSNYNNYGLFMTLSCILSVAMYSVKASRKYLWLASASALAVVLSISRHALLLLVIGIVLMFLFHRRKLLKASRLPRVFAIGLCVCALGAVVGISSPAIRARVASVVSPEVVGGDPAANIRLFLTLVLPPRFLHATPFFGQGPIAAEDVLPVGTGYISQGPEFKAAPDVPRWATVYIGDVVWVMILGLYGCCGLAAFGWVLWKIGKATNKIRKASSIAEFKALAEATLVALVALTISGMFSLEIISRDTVPVFWVLSGMILSLAANPPYSAKDHPTPTHSFSY